MSEKPLQLFDSVTIGAFALFVGFFGSSLTYPFLQSQRDKFQCDALCFGGMQSVRSGLSLLGNVLVGRLSDRYGRLAALYIGTAASLFSFLLNYYGTNIYALWIAMIPAALLNQNFGVMKALFADISHYKGYSDSERASAIGKLGMAAGFSFMLGPMAAATLFTTYHDAALVAFLLTIVSGLLLTQITPPENTIAVNAKDNEQKPDIAKSSNILLTIKQNVVDIFFIPSVKIPGAQLLLAIRCCMSMAFNIFMIIWTVSLKERFNFGPQDHAYFMGWIGLCYSISQGFLAKFFLQLSGSDPTRLLQICVLFLGLGRVMAMSTSSVAMVYAIMAAVIVALGIVNTAMSSACAKLASKDEVGGLFGVLEAVESLAGMIGPAFGGVLQRMHPRLPICSVVGVYGIVFLLITSGYRRYVIEYVPPVSALVSEDATKKENEVIASEISKKNQ